MINVTLTLLNIPAVSVRVRRGSGLQGAGRVPGVGGGEGRQGTQRLYLAVPGQH